MEPCSSASVIHHTTQKRAREERNWFWLVNCLAKSRWQNNAPFEVGRWKTLGTRLHGVNKLLRTVQTVPYPQCLWSSWHSVASWMPGIAQTVDIFSVLLYSASYPLRPHPSISTFRPQRKLKIIVKPVHLDSFEYKFRYKLSRRAQEKSEEHKNKKKNERIQQVYTSNDRGAYCIITMHGRSTIKEKKNDNDTLYFKRIARNSYKTRQLGAHI